MDDALRRHELRSRCAIDLWGHGRIDPIDHLAQLPDDVAADLYGDGGVVAELEDEVAALMGRPSAVFMPTGTMAQQIALRLHARACGSTTVFGHPLMHPRVHEGEPLERLHGLTLRPIGSPDRLITTEDLASVSEPSGTLLLELPQREIGSQLPPWEALTAQCQLARDRGWQLHLDGARLWEAQARYGRPFAQIAALFDTVYVSFYKGLGAVGGAALIGDHDAIAEAREWRHRMGGRAIHLWPLAASALVNLRLRLERMPSYADAMAAIADGLSSVDGVRLVPDPPHTNAAHVLIENDIASVRARAVELAATRGVSTWLPQPGPVPGWSRVEITVGDGVLRAGADVAVDAVRHLLRPVVTGSPADQMVEVVDEDGAIIDVVTRARIRSEGLRHRATYIAVVNGPGELIVHRRSENKDVNPGLWDVVFGGVCDVGEGWADAAARELQEEAGISGAPLTFVTQVTWDDAASADHPGAALVGRLYTARWDAEVSAADGEVAEFSTVPIGDLAAWVDAHTICSDTAEAVLPALLSALAAPGTSVPDGGGLPSGQAARR